MLLLLLLSTCCLRLLACPAPPSARSARPRLQSIPGLARDLPPHAIRLSTRSMHYALETHGVTAVRMAPAPSAAELRPQRSIFSAETGAFIVKWIPYALVALVYAATSYVRWKKVRWACGL